jgi:hypothetical protein
MGSGNFPSETGIQQIIKQGNCIDVMPSENRFCALTPS